MRLVLSDLIEKPLTLSEIYVVEVLQEIEDYYSDGVEDALFEQLAKEIANATEKEIKDTLLRSIA